MTTIKELATVLNLSPSTISKALNDSSEISSRTKLRVRETAKTYGYIANNAARSLRLKRTRTIGVVVPNVMDDFFGKVLHGIEMEASKHDYTVLITFSNDKKIQEDRNLHSLVNHGVDGILISFSKETQSKGNYDNISEYELYGMPIVMFDRISKELDFDCVCINDFNGAYQATAHLLSTGCKKVAFLSPISTTSVGRSRKDGYTRAMVDKNGHGPIYIELPDYTNFKEVLRQKIAEHSIDGILATDEFSAICCVNSIPQLGYKIPEDISIIGFTDGPMAGVTNPPLSVVSQHGEHMGRRAFRTFLSRFSRPGKDGPMTSVLEPELVLRGSTREI